METKNLSPYDLFEPDVDITGKSVEDDLVMTLWQRNMIMKQQMFAYWQPFYDLGKKCFDYCHGKIFTAKEKREMIDIEEKIPVEPRIMQGRIMSLVGEIMMGRRSGAVTTEGGSIDHPAVSAPLIEIANMVMKDMEAKWDERTLTREWLFNTLISCLPNWVWIDKALPADGGGVLKASLLPWDSTAVGPFNFKKTNGSDMHSIVFVDYYKEAELIEMLPEMEDAIKKHKEETKTKDNSFLTMLKEWNGATTASDRDLIYSNAINGVSAMTAPDGFYEVFTRVFPVKKKELVAVNISDPKCFHVRPPDFDDARWNAFIKEQESMGVPYEEAERTVTVLWQCRWTSCGLMLENKKHWYQENGELPGACFIPMLLNGVSTGPAVSELIEILTTAVFETEFLHEMRLSGNSFWGLRERTVTSIDSFPKEVNKRNGVVTIAQEAGPFDQCIKEFTRTPNKAALEYAMKKRQDLEEVDRINQSMQGASAPRQAAVAKNLEIAQGMLAQSQYVENFNSSWERFQNLKCKLIPYGYNKYNILKITDEMTGETKVAPLNEPQYGIDGSVEAVANDLSRHEFTYKMSVVDDSPTAKQREQEAFVIFMNAVPGPMLQADPTGKMLARYMMAMQNNNMLQKAGQALAKDADMKQQSMSQQEAQKTQAEMQAKIGKLKIEAEKVKKMGFALGITGEQLVQFPLLAQYLEQAGLITQPVQQAPAAPQVPAAPAPQPELQPVGAEAPVVQ